ncbi:hypothetical protein HNP46_004217 [Pseudomonas nitritireducens]|uniref:Lipoprotein n=1 Tax=Pseudomonas nitroreducens TaxID=46680 RepID=A0A7W7KMR3_PSENT|nr:hypothetical protein [Pseudomonas nitritireducens]MBB4865336.1 hypothetical protein [Pseudomonas nitritireducens]
MRFSLLTFSLALFLVAGCDGQAQRAGNQPTSKVTICNNGVHCAEPIQAVSFKR